MGVFTDAIVKSNAILLRRRSAVVVTLIALLATGSVLCDQATAVLPPSSWHGEHRSGTGNGA